MFIFSYVKTLTDPLVIDDYFETLLDMSQPRNRKFLDEFKEQFADRKRVTESKSKQKAPKPKTQSSRAVHNEPPTLSENKKPPSNNKTNPSQSNASQKNTGTKKKTGYTNLYAQDGTVNNVIMLKGRRLCNCEATKHKLISNCLRCGRIVCEQEGSGPCLFCGNLVCTDEEQRLIESDSSSGKQLKKTLTAQDRPEGWEAAMAMRNRLIDYDRMSEKRTTVIDDESDYFRTNSVWLSDEERARLKTIEVKLNEKKFASRREQKVTIDFGGRAIVAEPLVSEEFEDEILDEIAQAMKTPGDGQAIKSFLSQDSDAQDFNSEFPMPIVSLDFKCIFYHPQSFHFLSPSKLPFFVTV